MSHPLARLAFTAVAVLALSACGDDAQRFTAPEALRSSSSGPAVLECPNDTERNGTAIIGPVGGEVSVNGHRLQLPLGAVKGFTELTMTEPVSNYMAVQVRANGNEHFQFEKPVSLSISYDRCTRSNIEKGDLRIYYVDETGKTILQDMGGVDDKSARTVTTTTDHLSQFAVGSP